MHIIDTHTVCSKCNLGAPSQQTSNAVCSLCGMCAVCCAKSKSTCGRGQAGATSTHTIVSTQGRKGVTECRWCGGQLGCVECSASVCDECRFCAVCCAFSPICGGKSSGEVDIYKTEQEKRGLVVGALVERNPADWKWGDQVALWFFFPLSFQIFDFMRCLIENYFQDGGAGKHGLIISRNADGWMAVMWESSISNNYRCGAQGAFDIMLAREKKDTKPVDSKSVEKKDAKPVDKTSIIVTGCDFQNNNGVFQYAGQRNGHPCYTRNPSPGALYFDGTHWKLCQAGNGLEETGWNYSQLPYREGLPLGRWTQGKKVSGEKPREYGYMMVRRKTIVDRKGAVKLKMTWARQNQVTVTDEKKKIRFDKVKFNFE